MENKKVVVALGRNAFGDTFPKQQENVKKAAKAIADLVEEKYEVVITHSNGPQVGMIQTAMTDELPEEVKKSYLSQIPLARFGQAEDVANAAVFLASEKASYITGQVIEVTGGM